MTVLHDWQHASKIFVNNNFRLSPKYKWQFIVVFYPSQPVSLDKSVIKEISYLCKSVDLPKITPVIKEMNQYNHRIWNQNQIKYDPITIKIHDDLNNNQRKFLQNYYNYYFNDGFYDRDAYTYDDRYRDRRASAWGLDKNIQSEYLDKIEIYSLYNPDRASKLTIWRPVVSSFTQDTHDNFDGQGIMESTMSFMYTAIQWDANISGDQVPNLKDSGRWDSKPSPNLTGPDEIASDAAQAHFQSTGKGLFNDDFNTGGGASYGAMQNSQYMNDAGVYMGTSGITGDNQSTGSIYSSQSPSATASVQIDLRQQNYNPYTGAVYNDNQISQIMNSNYTYYNDALNFPVITQVSASTSYNSSENIPGSTTITNQNQTYSPKTINVYATNSWQSTLFNKGYSKQQIEAASQYIGSLTADQINSVNLVQLAESYISNPTNTSLVNVTYGRNTNTISLANDPLQSGSPVYNNNDWRQILRDQGYSKSDIDMAAAQLNQLNLNPSVDLVKIAQQYILANKRTAASVV